MSALDDLLNKSPSQTTDLDWAVISLEPNTVTAERAAERLVALEHLAAVARDVNEWLKAIDMGGTGHQRSLEAALAEYDKCRAA